MPQKGPPPSFNEYRWDKNDILSDDLIRSQWLDLLLGSPRFENTKLNDALDAFKATMMSKVKRTCSKEELVNHATPKDLDACAEDVMVHILGYKDAETGEL